MKVYDMLIVGGGPAGLTAGLYASRSTLDALLFERMVPGGQIVNTEWVEDYPGFGKIRGAELAEKIREHSQSFGLQILQENVKEVYTEGDLRCVKTENAEYKALTVLVAPGGFPRRLGVPGEAKLNGKGVSYCGICDGAFFKDQRIMVAGGGDSAAEEAHFLTKFGSHVHMVHRRDELRAKRILQERVLKNPKITVIWDTVVTEIKGDTEVRSVLLKNVKTGEITEQETEGVFIFIGFKPNSGVIRDPVELDQDGHIITSRHMETSIKGIFAAGDVRSQIVRQITNSVGDATVAVVAAERYIEALKEKGVK